MSNRNNLYIPSIDAKDLYLANNYLKDKDKDKDIKIGYSLYTKKNKINYKKFKNSFDYSLDLIELREIEKEVYKDTNDHLSFKSEKKEYSDKIINVTFKYSVKLFNKVSGNLYLLNGYDLSSITFEDCIARNENNEIIGVIVDKDIKNEIDDLPVYFGVKNKDGVKQYELIKESKTIKNNKKLREYIYKNGFYCNGIKYRRFKRSSGSARVGKCLFIDERLYDKMHKSEQCGLTYKEGDKIDLAALEAYNSLTTSSIIDVLEIKPENILVVNDYNSNFKEVAVITEADENGNLYSEEREADISNSIWDGQSLIDISLLGKYSDRGMVLLRNKFFKSCCFNTNIQKFFKDNNITSIEQLNGRTIAKNIEDIKLITTPSSIKYFKFGKFETWLQNIFSNFGVVKYDKDTHFFKGNMVQAHYQLINTLQLTKENMEELLRPSLEYINMINSDIDILRYHIKCKILDTDNEDFNNIMTDTNAIIYKMLSFNCDFDKTKILYDFRRELIKTYLSNLKKGHILINGTYATLFGNPLEMLKESIGIFDGVSSIPIGCVHNTRYEYDTEILGCRSPHVTMGNILVTKNIKNDKIDKYFNLTKRIICINSIGENILERLSGADFDSDQMIITNNEILINAAKKNYDLFKVPTSNVHANKTIRRYTMEDLSDLDSKTGKNKIGEIINLSQDLNSYLWDTLKKIVKENKKREKNKEQLINVFEEIKDIYYDVCQLDVMSCIEIDKAKKEFKVDNTKELNKLRKKYFDKLTVIDSYNEKSKRIKPKFLGYIAKTKNYYDSNSKEYVYHDTSMDYLHKILSKYRSDKVNSKDFMPLSEIFKPDNYNKSKVNYKQINPIINMVENTQKYINNIWSRKDIETNEERFNSVNCAKEDLCEYIQSYKLNPSTMYRLICIIDDNKYSHISRLLFYTLFNYNNESFIELLKNKEKVDTVLVPYKNGDVEIYDMKFIKKKINNSDFYKNDV